MKIPAEWKNECVDRMLKVAPAFTYKTEMSQSDCAKAGLNFDKWTGCDSRCAAKGKSFNQATKQCEWDEEPEEEYEEPMDLPPPPPVAVLPLPLANPKSKCQMGNAVQKAMARFADMAGMQCKTGAVELMFGVAASATLLGSAL